MKTARDDDIMAGRKIYAVLTGDLIGSREIKKACGEECIYHLKNTLAEIGKEYAVPFSIFRGDSFQGVSSKPEDALKDAILLRLKLISGLDPDNTKTRLDARIAIGIGTVNYLPKDGSAGEGDGKAFQLSGLELDTMKELGQSLLANTPWDDYNSLLSIFCDIVDRTVNAYTKRQAEAVMLKLEGFTQREIGDKIGKSQSAVSHRLKGTHYDLIVKIIEQYKLQIREQIELAENIEDQSDEAKMLLERGKYYLSTFRYSKALNLFSQSFVTCSQVHDYMGKASSLAYIGHASFYLRKFDDALNFYNQSLEIYRDLENKTAGSVLLYSIGMTYQKMHRHDTALEYYDRSLAISREIGNRESEASALHQIGMVHEDKNRPGEALEFYNRSLKIRREIGDWAGQAGTLQRIKALEAKKDRK